MRFADIIGQEELKRHLVQGIDSGRVSHAQLFTGSAGRGALALAVAYVQYLCCRHRRNGDSCGECPDCRQIAELAHPDLHLVFPVNRQGKKSGEAVRSDEFLPLFRELFTRTGGSFSPQMWYDSLDLGKTLKGMISAREADDIIRKLSFKSYEAEYKTMLVWLPETMNEEAANKLLKILEEPWERTLFLLVSEQPELLLPTILSRTQEVTVPRLEPRVLEEEAFRRDMARLLRESFVLHAGIDSVCYLWGEELDFCRKFCPYVDSHNIEPLVAQVESAQAQISQNGNPTIVFTHFALAVSKMIGLR